MCDSNRQNQQERERERDGERMRQRIGGRGTEEEGAFSHDGRKDNDPPLRDLDEY